MTDNENVEVAIENNVEVEEIKDTQSETMQKPKVKKPRSPAQVESLKKAHLARQEKFAEKKRLMMLEKEEREERMKKIKEREEQEEQADNEESDEELLSPVKKPKAKPKKKIKKAPKVVFEDSESDEEQEIIIRKVRRNKKEKESVKPTSPINIPVPKENEILPSVNEIEESIIDKEKKYTHSEILKMMGM